MQWRQRVEMVAGRTFAAMIRLVASARRGGRKSLHPRGEVLPALVRRMGSTTKTGVRWLDEAGTDRVLVRQSRSLGLPHPFPDVLGLALRIPEESHGYGDVLLATTGTGVPGRFLLRPVGHAQRAAYSSLFPYRTPIGPLVLAAFPTGRSGLFELAWAPLLGRWRRFATLDLLHGAADAEGPDAPIAFDPVLNVIPGLEPYGWSRRLREASYAASRRARADRDLKTDGSTGHAT